MNMNDPLRKALKDLLDLVESNRPDSYHSEHQAITKARAALAREPVDDDVKLHRTMDAKVWAQEFCRLNTAADEGTMIGWFANAIMAGYDEANRRNQASQPRVSKEDDEKV